MLASVYSYRVMVKSVSSCCVRGRRVLSNPVTYIHVLKIITCRSIGRVAKMNGMSCTSIAMMEWGVTIDVLTGCTLKILYAYHDIMILCLHY